MFLTSKAASHIQTKSQARKHSKSEAFEFKYLNSTLYTDDAESNCHQRIQCFDQIWVRFRSCAYSIIVCSIIHCETSQTHCKQSNQLCPNTMSKILVVSQDIQHFVSPRMSYCKPHQDTLHLKRPVTKSLTLTASKSVRTYVPTFITPPHSQCRQTQWHTQLSGGCR